MTQPKLSNLALWGLSNAWQEGRAYRHPHTGVRFPSITTILKMADRGGLAQWAADQAIAWAVINWELLGTRSPEDGYKAGRFRWKDVRDERGIVGTGVHETLESLNSGGWNFPPLDDEQKRIMEQWDMLCQEHEITPQLSEFTVVNAEDGYMGTADATLLIDGKLCLVDYKTSKNTWPEHFYQLAALWKAPKWLIETEDMVWDEIDAPKVDAVKIIHLREDKHEIIDVLDLDLQYDVFKGYADVWRGKEAVKAAEKKRSTASYGGFDTLDKKEENKA